MVERYYDINIRNVLQRLKSLAFSSLKHFLSLEFITAAMMSLTEACCLWYKLPKGVFLWERFVRHT